MRYLVPFHPKRHPHFFTDVLIIGGGIAGLRAAIACDPSLRVLVLCKAGLLNSNSYQAQGGIATVWEPDDTIEQHVQDTLIAGAGLCEENVVRHVVVSGPKHLEDIIQFGVNFDQHNGQFLLGREGGHCRDRILHASGDATGKEMVRALAEEVLKRPNIRVWENTFTLDLLTTTTVGQVAKTGHSDGVPSPFPAAINTPNSARSPCTEVCGAVVYWKKHDEKELIWAKQTILASGSVGQLYRETTNPDVATGDGVAMAWRAGAEIRDMEFIQFHPTVLYIAGGSRSLITEAIRGEGGHLIDKNGHRFMPEYDTRDELAPRDVVSLAIVRQLQKTHYPNVYLDLRHLDAEFLYKRFPGITAICQTFGLDIAKDPIPVRPGAHYSMGGVRVDVDGRTTLARLWAAGEVACTGLHGANRLASNSLLETLVYGESCGRLASQLAKTMPDDYHLVPLENPPLDVSKSSSSGEPQLDLADIRNALKSLMWRTAGILRTSDGLNDALGHIHHWSRYVLHHQFTTAEGWELQNMLTVARLILTAALNRPHSIGAHNIET